MNIRRILIDAAGYLVIVAALLTGWLPGPGGIPLLLVGLGLLSVYNPWAKRLRERLTRASDNLGTSLSSAGRPFLVVYDLTVILLLATAAVLFWRHGDRWQVGLAGVGVGVAVGLGFVSRRRYARMLRKHKLGS